MRLESLHIRRLPGLAGPLHVTGLAPGVNVITGANASGKSSLVRALRLLLAPHRNDPNQVVLEAVFSDQQHGWSVSRYGRETEWQCDGQDNTAPALPDREALSGYFLPVDELLAMSGNDTAVVRRLQQELAGGYDLPALRRDGGPLSTHPKTDRRSGDALTAAEDALRRAEAGNRALLDERAKLPQLDKAIERAGTALHHARELEAAVELATARRTTREAEQALARFPEAMPEGVSQDDLETLEGERQQHLDAVRQGEKDAERADERLRETGMVETAPEPEAISAQRQRTDALRDQLNHAEQAREAVRAANATAGETTQLLGTPISESLDLTTDRLARLDEAVRELTQATDVMDQARAAREGAATNRARLSVPRALMAAACVAGSAGALAWLAAQPAAALTAIAVVALGVAGLTGVLWYSLRRGRGVDQRALDERLRAAEQAQEAARQRVFTEAGAAGLEPDPDHLGRHFPLFLQRVRTLDEARTQARAAEARAAGHADHAENLRTPVGAFLETWQARPASEDPVDLNAALEQVERTRQDALRFADQLNQANTDRERALRYLQQADERLTALYHRAGLEPGDRETLLTRIRALPAWESARDALADARSREDMVRQRLAQAPAEVVATADREDTATLEQQLNQARAEAGQHEQRVQERARIHERIAAAEQQLQLETARAERDRAREALEERFEQRMVAEAGRFLLDEVEREHRSRHQPVAVRVADTWLRQFTHERYHLELDSAGNPCAWDTTADTHRSLGELSVGTRMQLLIALRMAWVQQQEDRHVALPLLLDEALSTTDPDRFRAVAQALHSLTTEQGRQLIYLTAQPDDIARWHQATGQEPRVIDLDTLRQRTPAHPPSPAPQGRERVPSPQGHDRSSYAQALGVPKLDPLAPSGELHLWYLLGDDLDLLYRLLADFRVSTLGQAESLLDGPAARQHLEAGTRTRLSNRCAAARAWLEAWRIGRGLPVGRPELEQSPLGTSQYLEEIVERAATVGGDPDRLVHSLESERISGVGPKKIGDLSQWLLEQGYCDQREPLDETGRYHRALALLSAGTNAISDAQTVVAALEAAAAAGLSSDDTIMAGW